MKKFLSNGGKKNCNTLKSLDEWKANGRVGFEFFVQPTSHDNVLENFET